MADVGPKVHAVPPESRAVTRLVSALAKPRSIVSAYDDSRLRLLADSVELPEDAEFVAIGDLVGKVLTMLGLPLGRVATRTQRVAMTAIACESLGGDSPLECSSRFPGTVNAMMKSLDELRHFGVESPEIRQIANALSTVSSSRTKKLEVLAEVGDLVQDSLDVSRREHVTDRIHRCLNETLPPGPLSHVIVWCGPDEHPVFDHWILWLSKNIKRIDCLVDMLPSNPELFLEAQRTTVRLGTNTTVIKTDPAWYAHLFTDSPPANSDVSVDVVGGQDPLNEAEIVVLRCLELTQSGVQAERIGILVSDEEEYAPLIESCATKAGLKLDHKRTVPLLSCGFAIAVSNLLTSFVSSDPRDLARLAQSNYWTTDKDEQAEIWRVVTTSLRDKTNPIDDLLTFANTRPSFPAWLSFALQWIVEHRTGSYRLTTWLDHFRNLVGQAAVVEASTTTEGSASDRDLRAQTVMQRTIADYAFVYDQAGRSELSLRAFVRLAERIWKEESVALPGLPGAVRVFQNSHALPSLDTLFVVGLVEGKVPKRRREDPILFDEDRGFISSLIPYGLSNSGDKLRGEAQNFVRACASVEARLVLSYPVTSAEGDTVPSHYLEVVTGKPTEESVYLAGTKSIWPEPLQEGLTTSEDRLTEEYARDLVRQDWNVPVEVRELASAALCPFRAAFRNKLHLRPPLSVIGLSTLVDLPRRARLAEIQSREEAVPALARQLDQLLDRLAPKLDPWEFELLRAVGQRYCNDLLDREFAARKTWPRDSGSVRSNVPLGHEGLRKSPTVAGRKIHLLNIEDSVFMYKGVSVVQAFHPGFDKTSVAKLLDPQSLEMAMKFFVQHKRSPMGSALEVDSLTGERILLFLRETRPIGVPQDAFGNLYALSTEGTPIELLKVVAGHFEAAVNNMERSDARAIPGAHCQGCQYAEICRHSAEHSFLTIGDGE